MDHRHSPRWQNRKRKDRAYVQAFDRWMCRKRHRLFRSRASRSRATVGALVSPCPWARAMNRAGRSLWRKDRFEARPLCWRYEPPQVPSSVTILAALGSAIVLATAFDALTGAAQLTIRPVGCLQVNTGGLRPLNVTPCHHRRVHRTGAFQKAIHSPRHKNRIKRGNIGFSKS